MKSHYCGLWNLIKLINLRYFLSLLKKQFSVINKKYLKKVIKNQWKHQEFSITRRWFSRNLGQGCSSNEIRNMKLKSYLSEVFTELTLKGIFTKKYKTYKNEQMSSCVLTMAIFYLFLHAHKIFLCRLLLALFTVFVFNFHS